MRIEYSKALGLSARSGLNSRVDSDLFLLSGFCFFCGRDRDGLLASVVNIANIANGGTQLPKKEKNHILSIAKAPTSILPRYPGVKNPQWNLAKQ